MQKKHSRAVILMGVAGSGKTAVGMRVAQKLDWIFLDADDFHPPANIEKMKHGIPLNDQDRAPWLQRLHNELQRQIAEGHSAILACSALKESYRKMLRDGVPSSTFVCLDVDPETIRARLQHRTTHFFPKELMESQFAALEKPKDAIIIDARKPLDEVVAQLIQALAMNANESVSPRFQHVTITFPLGQEARVRSFYAGTLGLREKPIPKVVKPLGWIWFDTGAPGVELHCVPDEQLVPPDTRHHFCLEIDDMERQRRALIDSGTKIIEARALPLRPRFFARDPFNNLIEFVQIQGDYIAAGEAAD